MRKKTRKDGKGVARSAGPGNNWINNKSFPLASIPVPSFAVFRRLALVGNKRSGETKEKKMKKFISQTGSTERRTCQNRLHRNSDAEGIFSFVVCACARVTGYLCFTAMNTRRSVYIDYACRKEKLLCADSSQSPGRNHRTPFDE